VLDGVPAGLLKQAGLVILQRLPARQDCLWLVDCGGALGVLRRLDPPDWAANADVAADVEWVHGFLRQLAAADFAAPRPLPVFGQRSWTETGAGVWEVVSFVPGEVVGSAGVPMEAVGGLLARYHSAACQVPVATQRPVALPVARVPAALASAEWPAAAEGEQVRLIRYLAGELAADLDQAGQERMPQLVIHGDFTNHNVTATGQPPRPGGVIDFALAHLESPLADIGYGLWRSGRPYDTAVSVDMQRAQRFVRGYASVRPLSADDAEVIEMFMRGRGLQIIAKRVLAGRPDLRPPAQAQVQWLSTHRQLVTDALAAAMA
jgi:homoserine kinase type II